jgi:hypothetical protein
MSAQLGIAEGRIAIAQDDEVVAGPEHSRPEKEILSERVQKRPGGEHFHIARRHHRPLGLDGDHLRVPLDLSNADRDLRLAQVDRPQGSLDVGGKIGGGGRCATQGCGDGGQDWQEAEGRASHGETLSGRGRPNPQSPSHRSRSASVVRLGCGRAQTEMSVRAVMCRA